MQGGSEGYAGSTCACFNTGRGASAWVMQVLFAKWYKRQLGAYMVVVVVVLLLLLRTAVVN